MYRCVHRLSMGRNSNSSSLFASVYLNSFVPSQCQTSTDPSPQPLLTRNSIRQRKERSERFCEEHVRRPVLPSNARVRRVIQFERRDVAHSRLHAKQGRHQANERGRRAKRNRGHIPEFVSELAQHASALHYTSLLCC